MQILAPISPYTGNKSKSIDLVLSQLPPDMSHFYDVFGGSGVVGMNVAVNTDTPVTYNEIDSHISTLMFHCLNTSYFINLIKHEDSVYPETKEGYLALRAKYNATHYSPEKYARLYCLIARSFSNICRHNRKGEFNAPYGERNHLRLGALREARSRLNSKAIGLLGVDYKNVLTGLLERSNEGVVSYLDPPYSITTATYCSGWNEQDSITMREMLDELTLAGTRWMYHDVLHNRGKENSPLIQWLEENNYNVVDSNGDFSNSSFRKTSGKTQEVLIKNF